ncbi:hypothetical protein MBAV_006158 [Candidatus Magnetobacterium bavaricum]|uniref:Uncharacterized protein n=1 Tax=Candidatus Magnetobacterium bavaricum TaxID=29290 RepID=A0A0F3GI80_9BACT|nr:hypothetical protein MBAV_006158 [Candidatus Magnetobacterium bavaricum]
MASPIPLPIERHLYTSPATIVALSSETGNPQPSTHLTPLFTISLAKGSNFSPSTPPVEQPERKRILGE